MKRKFDAHADRGNPAPIHPLWMRITHWLNALAVVIMVTSGWQIYNASPIFGFEFPKQITLGGWLAGAIQWHFAAMWLLALNGLVYLALNIASGRLARKFFPLSIAGIWCDATAALHGKLSHADVRQYNYVQRLAYLFVMLDIVLLVLSGLVIFKSVQFPMLTGLIGGFDMARRIHFFGMAALVAFFLLHVVMVVLVPKTFPIMFVGRTNKTS